MERKQTVTQEALLEEVAAEFNISPASVRMAFGRLIRLIERHLQDGYVVEFPEIGRFELITVTDSNNSSGTGTRRISFTPMEDVQND